MYEQLEDCGAEGEVRVGVASVKGTLGVSMPGGYSYKQGVLGKVVKTASTVSLTCPRCGKVGVLDVDQLHGRVSTRCFNELCDFHETVDWAKRLREHAGIIVRDGGDSDD